MKLMLSAVDWQTASAAAREPLAFPAAKVRSLLREIRAQAGVSGCVLLSTCNRTELYLTGDIGETPAQLLCRLTCLPELEPLFVTRCGEQAVNHLMEVTCGLRSQILGEDQILSQVRSALMTAQEEHTTDAVLSALFRNAVTAGKQCRTEVRLTAAPLSVAEYAVELAEKKYKNLSGTRAVVIGNGEMGRLTSRLLVERGCRVTVTLRSYRHGETIVPRGCATVPYDARMDAIDGCDLVFSATTSPHYTLTAEQLAGCAQPPALVCDLAMPRDVQPEAGAYTELLDMDSMTVDASHNREELARIHEVIEQSTAEFFRWYHHRDSLPVQEQLRELAAERVLESLAFAGLELHEEELPAAREAAQLAARQTVDYLLGSLTLSRGELEQALEKIRHRRRKP